MIDLPDLKKLDKLIALCRKRGVTEVQIGGLTLKLGEDFVPRKRNTPAYDTSSDEVVEPDFGGVPEELTEEEKMFWSVGGTPAGETSTEPSES